MGNGLGEIPLSWTEVDAWNRSTVSCLDPYDLETLVLMSKAYMSGNSDKNQFSIPPLRREDNDLEPEEFELDG